MKGDFNLPGINEWKIEFEEFHKVQEVTINPTGDALIVKVAFPTHDDPEKDNVVAKEITLRALNERFYASSYEHTPDIVSNLLIQWRSSLRSPLYFKDTLVAFFDIHAYSHFIEHEWPKCIGIMGQLLQNTEKNAGTGKRPLGIHFPHWILSDSIIISIDTHLKPIWRVSLRLFVATCAFVMDDAMKNGLPLRGAIGGGNFYLDEDKHLLISTALTDAAKYEKAQEWLGSVITPKALNIIRKHDVDFFKDDVIPTYVKYGQVPWKTGSQIGAIEEAYYIKPFSNPQWKDYLPSYFYSYPEFSASSFESQLAIDTLCSSIAEDQFEIQLPSEGNGIHWLNELIRSPSLYDKMASNEKFAIIDDFTKFRIQQLKEDYDNNLNDHDLKRLNRYLLESFYPQTTKGHYKKIENSHMLYT